MKSNYPVFFTFPLICYMCYIWYQHIRDENYWSYLDTVNFFIHEFGHFFFEIFWNQLLWIIGGTLMQIIVPFSLMLMFLVQKDYFAFSLCNWWIGINFFYISLYSSDAQDQLLPLIWTKGWYVIHDWNYIFSHFWVLDKTDIISMIFFTIWNIFLFFCVIYSLILIINSLRNF